MVAQARLAVFFKSLSFRYLPTKISVRNIRRDGNKHLDDEQKNKLISEDERDKGKKDIDNHTKEYTDKVDAIIKAKSEEIMLY